ncbi:phosphoribosyl-ATP pyrophosphohydrolase [Bacillus cereus]|uniref:nucleoside triphosphate pyrophosphohydrolase n=1 Tax=Bacillus cereus TaxID=1396 RepID=UPI000BF9B24A|nr:nucleoside triphosphate pyrophosphohydrolase [Bacillus cereus]PFL47594.1 phosphoribosyl-ATP pyrophosphohydrolase [Bacillus cereus]PFS33829.1 phosphoribosyl-ATP pyrophosphohydrolase [Bacillus cereus]
MPTYNKLIRNKVPQIIKANGKTPTTRSLPKDEYIKEICKKTEEEIKEYIEAKTKSDKLEELSDLLELINALAEQEGTTLEEISTTSEKKKA